MIATDSQPLKETLTLLENLWRNEQVWQVENMEETADITSFYLRTNYPDDHVQFLSIDKGLGQLRLSQAKPSET